MGFLKTKPDWQKTNIPAYRTVLRSSTVQWTMQNRDDFPDEFARGQHSNTFLLPLDKFNFFFNQRLCRLLVYFIEKVDVLSGRIAMEGKNRLLDCFVGNTETSTAVPLLDGSLPSDFKVLFRRKIGNIFDRYRASGFLLGSRPLKFDPVSKLDADGSTYGV